MTPNWKPSATARKIKTVETRTTRKSKEAGAKREARKRDGYRCRFPLCGCRKLKLRLEVSHDRHKGAGGNPSGDRSTREGLITMCVHRHQHGRISRDKGTLRVRHLTVAKNDGPIAWEVDLDIVAPLARVGGREDRWFEIARERAVQELDWLSPKQQILLERLAEMEL